LKKERFLKVTFLTLLGLSILIMAYAGFKIIYSNNAIEQSIQQWDNLNVLKEKNNQEQGSFDKDKPESNADEALEISYTIPQKDLMGTLIIQTTNERIPIINGITLADLQHGAGYFPKSALPGETGNCIILGHRETVFNRLGKIKLHDKLIIETLEKKMTFRVIETKIVDKISDNLLDPIDTARLTLITCYPIQLTGPVEQRYLVIAEMESY